MNVTVERVGNDATLKIISPASVKAKPPAILSKCTMAKKQ